MSETIVAGERTVELGSPDKVLFPDLGATKRDLAEHLLAVADVMLPHLQDRLLTLHRFPDGIGASGFYQKDVPDHFPDWIETHEVETRDGEHITQMTCQDEATLVYLADQACITPHVWPSRTGDLERPDRMIFDLDPPEDATGFDDVRSAARAVRDVLDRLGLEPFVMTTGSKGFHVVTPLRAEEEFDEVRDTARAIADTLAADHPDELTTEQRTSERSGRIFLDYLRNAYGQTTVAPYAVRSLPGAPVATPLDWDELGGTEPQTYTIDNIRRRLGQKDDPWSDIEGHRGSLAGVREKLARD